jgi:hypothetical protein
MTTRIITDSNGRKHITTEPLLHPEQEPVAFASHGVVNWIADKQFQHEALLYSAPQRTWVGLTDDDYKVLREGVVKQGKPIDWMIKQIEANLKEKNT